MNNFEKTINGGVEVHYEKEENGECYARVIIRVNEDTRSFFITGVDMPTVRQQVADLLVKEVGTIELKSQSTGN